MVARPFKKNEEAHQIKVDSYVLETNVHFPTDLNLAWDAARKIIDLTDRLTTELGLSGWRIKAYWKKSIKNPMRDCSRANKSGGANKQKSITMSATHYLAKLYQHEDKPGATLAQVRSQPLSPKKIFELQNISDFPPPHRD